jgi:predicted MFS family arabinose efflux permease
MALNLNYALMLLCFSSINSARLLLSLYALHLGAQPTAVGILYATFFAFPLVLSWPIGVLSDRMGTRWLLLAGTICGACGMLIPYFFGNMAAIFIAGITIGLAFSFYKVLLENLVGLLSKPHERAQNFSNASMIGAITHFIGPPIAGIAIDLYGHGAACLYMVGLSLTAAMVLVIWGSILPGGTHQPASGGSLRDTLADPAIVRILLISGFVQVGQDFFQYYTPIYGHGIGLTASAIGGALAAFAVASFVVRFIVPQLIAKLGEERLLARALCVAAAGFMLIPFSATATTLGIVCFVFGLGMGCGQPILSMLLFSQSAEGRSGAIFGLRQTANNVLRVATPTLFGFFASAFGMLPVFSLNALMLLAGGALSHRKQAPPNSTR